MVVRNLAKQSTVSAKIDESLRKKMLELGIKPSEVIRRALEEEVERRSRDLLTKKAAQVREISKGISRADWERAFDHSRDEK
jgi:hypothetical protein